MNILVICHYGLYQHLSASFVHAQTRAYRALGHRVRVIVPIAMGKPDWDGTRFSGHLRQREEDGVEVLTVRHLSLSNYGRKHFNTASALRTIQKNFNTLLEDFQPDIIHAHTLGYDSAIGALLKAQLGIPLVVTTHGETVCDKEWENSSLLRQTADRADAVIPVSSMLHKQLLNAGVSTTTRVILNGFHIQNIPTQEEKAPLSLIQVGFLMAHKKVDITICAAAKLRLTHPEVILDIIGSGSEYTRLQSLCKELNIESSVHFYGYLQNIETLAKMARARFFVMPSIPEGFGIVYLEAMASGCITIGTQGQGIADLIISGENGFLVPPDDPDSIVRVIEWCLAHPKEADLIAERGRKDALGLTWERNAKQYTALFQELLNP